MANDVDPEGGFDPAFRMPSVQVQSGRGIALMSALTDAMSVGQDSGRATAMLTRRW